MIEFALYLVARTLIASLQALPLPWVVRLGRFGGTLFYYLDARHRRVVFKNLELCFGREKSVAEIKSIAQETFKRIGENFASAVKTAAMSLEELKPYFSHRGFEPTQNWTGGCIGAVGHFGNFEIYARLRTAFPAALKMATTYRGIKQKRLDGLLQQLRSRSGCIYFERRTDAARIKAAMNEGGMALGFLADQHAGKSGVDVPFFGQICATSTAPAVFALRYNLPLFVAICFRTGPGQWLLEMTHEIPTRENGKARSVEAIMTDVNQAFEQAIRRDPANWFWVHNRWKVIPRQPKDRAGKRALRTENEDVALES